ncbi:MAG: MaoC family dehydratase [Candidatus Aminicenantes bacterium]|nr:MaoC family dehydratase [Candidatus Aminicenantes bacterium]
MSDRLSIRALKAQIGKELILSDWLTMTQDRIDAFAACSEDRQWIHVDPERAAAGPLKGTVAHGFLVLSLIPHWLAESSIFQARFRMAVNYGLDRVRFVRPVRPGQRIRLRAVLHEVERKGFFRLLLKIGATVEIEGQAKPALAAEVLGLIVL